MIKKKVIWVDDNIELLKSSEFIFNENGIELILCSSIAQALKQVLAGVSNNLLLDINFPQNPKEGLIFLEQIKKVNPQLKVVLFTGYPETDEGVIAIKELMASDYIAKPIPLDYKKRHLFFQRILNSFEDEQEVNFFLSSHTESAKIQKLKSSLENYDLKTFFDIMKSIFAGLTYNMKTQESYYHGYIHIILDLIGMNIDSEVETNIGRIDAVVETNRFIYLMEFKLKNSHIALNQIKKRKYFQKYLGFNKEIILVGVSFDSKEKNICEYIAEKYG